MDIKSIAYTSIKVKSALESVAASLEGVTTAYDVWIAAGNQGSMEDYIASLKGDPGDMTAEELDAAIGAAVEPVTSQLAEKANQIDLNNTNANIINLSNTKADKSEVTEGYNLLKGDLADLATFGNNLFNKETAIVGYTLTSTGDITNDGTVVSNASQYLTSDYIPCSKYIGWYFCIAPSNGSVCFYDSDKNFISKVDNILYHNKRKVVNGAYYLRFTTPKSQLDTTTARVFDVLPTEAPVYDDYGIKINDDVNIKSDDSKLDKNQGTDNSDKYMKVDNDGNLVPSDPPVDDRLFIGGTVTNAGQQEETISIGVNAGRNIQNGYIAIGHGAMGKATESTTDNDNGKYSTAIGHRALGQNTTGDHNTAVGWGCLSGNTTGNGNTALGQDALCHGNGDSNTCIGNRAYQRGQGSRNVVVGAGAMYTPDNSVEVPSGVENVSVGNSSGCPSGSGSKNTCIGHEARTIENIDYSTAIGYRSKARKSQQVVIGYTTNDIRYRILETLLNGDIVIHGTDNKFRKLTFNDDGSIGWIDVSSDYSDYINN